ARGGGAAPPGRGVPPLAAPGVLRRSPTAGARLPLSFPGGEAAAGRRRRHAVRQALAAERVPQRRPLSPPHPEAPAGPRGGRSLRERSVPGPLAAVDPSGDGSGGGRSGGSSESARGAVAARLGGGDAAAGAATRHAESARARGLLGLPPGRGLRRRGHLPPLPSRNAGHGALPALAG